ncbi:MAG: ABC transporter ATP-binding protein [Pseudomonadota bacterium]
MTRLRARGVTVDLGGRAALDGFDLDAGAGEVVGLIGANGAGKSTALKAMARLLRRRAGEVRLDDRPIERFGARELARRLAYLPQGHQVNWPMSVERLVGLGRLPWRGPFAGPSAADAIAVADAMERADVSRFAGRAATELSGGERARAALARALAVEAEILFADEPVASLDPYHQLQVMELLRGAAGDGTLVIVVLHDLTLASRFCDRLVLLAEGRLVAEGAPSEVLAPERLAQAYGVEGFVGEHDAERFVLPWRRLARSG